MRNNLFLVGLTLLLTLQGCRLFKSGEDKGEIVARVNEKLLHDSDIPMSITNGLSPEDSARVLKAFVEAWVKEQVLVAKAEQNIVDSLSGLEDRIESYRNSLIVFEYERAIIRQKLDTAVSENEIDDYFRANKSNFLLQEPAFRFYYVAIPVLTHDAWRVKKYLRSLDPVQIEELKAYALGLGALVNFEDENWVSYTNMVDDLKSKFDKNSLYTGDPLKVVRDGQTTHYLYVLEYRKSGEIAPMELVQGDIKAKIVNDRKFKLINTMRNDLFNKALNNKDAEIFF